MQRPIRSPQNKTIQAQLVSLAIRPARRDRCRALLAALVALAALLAVGCASRSTVRPLAETKDFPMVDDKAALQLGPGDQIEIKFRYWPDLDDIQTVRPDGKITLQMVDEVEAAGRTPLELDTALTDMYKDKLTDPVISVIVRSVASRRVFIGGEVLVPGEKPLTGTTSALEAIMAAGGFDKRTAAMKNVVIIRTIKNKSYATLLDLSKSLYTPEATPFYLAPQDIVYVSPTKIDDLNVWVDKYINQTIPGGLNYGHPVGSRGTLGYSPPYTRPK